MKVVVTGSSKGIGKAIVKEFLKHKHTVCGIDILESPDDLRFENKYTHYQCDVRNKLPYIRDVDILINNAGVQDSGEDIDVNLKGTINCTETYGVRKGIKAIVNIASVSAHNGAEFPEYCASKGGMLAYTVNTAKRVAEYGATCNSISPGGVTTELNGVVLNDKHKWDLIMQETPLKQWASAEEIAQWVYFVAVVNKSMTGQDIIIDNGEFFNHTFIW